MRLNWPAINRKAVVGWLLVGFALAGFFDGIVLHQILQWHHLLSGLPEPAGSDLRFQFLADGLFHLLMYLLCILGTVLLVAARASGARPGTTSEILRLALAAFGIWHIVDAVIIHWLLGLHRIRMSSEVPLAWDIGWLVIFGILPLVLVLLMPNRGGPARGAAAALMSVAMLAGLTAGAGQRFEGATHTIVVFREGLSPVQMMRAVLEARTNLKSTDKGGTIWVVDEVSWAGLITLHAEGAVLVSTTPVAAGCLAWSAVKV